MKYYIGACLVFLVCFTLVLGFFQYKDRAVWPIEGALPNKPLLDGSLQISDNEIKDLVRRAQIELRDRNKAAAVRRSWVDHISWCAIVLTVITTLLLTLLGKSGATANESKEETMNRINRDNQNSKWLVRAIGVLVALGTVPNLVTQRLEAEATRFDSSAKELNDVMFSSLNKIYDPTTKLGQALLAKEQIEAAIGKH